MKTIYLIFSAILVSISGFAQQSNLYGTISDDNGIELERAWVLVLNSNDLSYETGTVTDENGNFAIEGVEKGEYVISVDHVSFDAPRIIGELNNQSNLNEMIKLETVQSGIEVTLSNQSADRVLFHSPLVSISGTAQQNNFFGTISDSYGKELERAWILVLNATDMSYVTGTVTDENGYFAIEGVEEGDYVISVDHVSFDAPRIMGKWNNQSNLNELIKFQTVQSGKEMSLHIQ